MGRQTIYSVIAYALLSGAGIVSFMMPPSLTQAGGVAPEPSPRVVVVGGTVRDSHANQPDVNVTPSKQKRVDDGLSDVHSRQ